MKTKCIYKNINLIPTETYEFFPGSPDATYAVEIGKEYIVYAMVVYGGNAWYYVCDENYTYYPRWMPCQLFDVIDGKMSRYWIYSYNKEIDPEALPIMAYPEWADNADYYPRLVDGFQEEVEIFKRYKELIDLESQELS